MQQLLCSTNSNQADEEGDLLMLCRLVYLDIGTNMGDSLVAFTMRKPESRLFDTFAAAVGDKWSPATTCVYGFEPNPRWTKKLLGLQKQLAPRVANLTIYTETAVGGPEQSSAPMWLVGSTTSPRGVGAHLTSHRPTRAGEDQHIEKVHTIWLARWLRDVCGPRHGWKTPVIVRMDTEGAEYDTLADLATSGIGQQMDIYVTVEWHRHEKKGFLGSREVGFMAMLDDRFHRYWARCGNGSCNNGVAEDHRVPKGAYNNSIENNLEKVVAFMLHRSGITFVDAFFDAGTGKKIKSPQDWQATRARRVELEQGLQAGGYEWRP